MSVCQLHQEEVAVIWDDEAFLLQVASQFTDCRNFLQMRRSCNNISGRSGRDAYEDCGALKVALGSMEVIGGNVEAEEEFVVADVVDIIVDVGRVKVYEVEETDR